MKDISFPSALITGASSGIGAAFAQRLAEQGSDLILVARRKERLDALSRALQSEHGVQVEVLVADLGSPSGVDMVAERLKTAPVDLLVNNAGFGLYLPLAETAEADMLDMIALNIVALARLTHAALPGMLRRGSGAIINVGSGLAFNLSATRATYSGSKTFVLNFTRSIEEEVRSAGVQMQALIPGLIRTEFHEHSGTDIGRIPPQMIMDALALVDGSLAGLRLGEVTCIPALPNVADLHGSEAAQSTVAQHLVRQGLLAERYGP